MHVIRVSRKSIVLNTKAQSKGSVSSKISYNVAV